MGYSGRGVKVTSHLHLVPRLRMGDAITLLPQNAFKQGIETDLSSAYARTIFDIVAPSTLISHGSSSRDAFRQ